MAFVEPKPKVLKILLREAENVSVTSHDPKVTGTLLCNNMTMGLKQTVAEISAKKTFGNIGFNRSHSDSSGRLIFVDKAFPLIQKRFKLIGLIGEGTFSQIFKAEDIYSSKRQVAVKIIQQAYDALGYRELLLLRYLASKTAKGPTPFVEIITQTRFDGHVIIVMPVYNATLLDLLQMPLINNESNERTDLIQPRIIRPSTIKCNQSKIVAVTETSGTSKCFERGTVSKLKRIAVSLLSALCVLRQEGIIHADIKPENCFIQCDDTAFWDEIAVMRKSAHATGQHSTSKAPKIPIDCLTSDFDIKLGDFGNSIHSSEIHQYYESFNIQSLPYRAPEVLFGLPFSSQIDVWSLGVVLFEVLSGKPLFIVRSTEDLCKVMVEKFGLFSPLRFSGGKFSGLFDNHFAASSQQPGNITSPMKISQLNSFSQPALMNSLATHLFCIQNLLQSLSFPKGADSSSVGDRPSADMISFFAGLLTLDPDLRFSPMDALRHPFLSSALPVPRSIFCSTNGSATGGVNSAVARLSLQSLRAKCAMVSEKSIVVVKARRGNEALVPHAWNSAANGSSGGGGDSASLQVYTKSCGSSTRPDLTQPLQPPPQPSLSVVRRSSISSSVNTLMGFVASAAVDADSGFSVVADGRAKGNTGIINSIGTHIENGKAEAKVGENEAFAQKSVTQSSVTDASRNFHVLPSAHQMHFVNKQITNTTTVADLPVHASRGSSSSGSGNANTSQRYQQQATGKASSQRCELDGLIQMSEGWVSVVNNSAGRKRSFASSNDSNLLNVGNSSSGPGGSSSSSGDGTAAARTEESSTVPPKRHNIAMTTSTAVLPVVRDSW